MRVLEAKRADDARHVRELETRLSEAESFVALRPKLQAKLNQQQTELIATRRELADAQQLAQLSEGRILDAQEQLEMAMLDKEMAEERAEVAEADVEELREKLAIMEVELQHLREGGSALCSTDMICSFGLIQLARRRGWWRVLSEAVPGLHSAREAERATQGGPYSTPRYHARDRAGASEEDIRDGEGPCWSRQPPR